MWLVRNFISFKLEPCQSFKVFKRTFLCVNFLFIVFFFAFKLTVTELQIFWWTFFTLLSCLLFSLWEVSYEFCNKVQLRICFFLCCCVRVFACSQGSWVVSADFFKVKEAQQRLHLINVIILLLCQLLTLRCYPNNRIAQKHNNFINQCWYFSVIVFQLFLWGYLTKLSWAFEHIWKELQNQNNLTFWKTWLKFFYVCLLLDFLRWDFFLLLWLLCLLMRLTWEFFDIKF